jgi:membrane protein
MGAAIVNATLTAWSEDKVPRLSVALAYYTLFSLAPLLIIVIGVTALIFGQEAAQGRIAGEIKGLVGDKGAEAIQAMLQNAGEQKSSGILATLAGIVTFLFGASGVFGELQDALNTIWGVKAKSGRGLVAIVRSRFFSFAMVLGIVFMHAISMDMVINHMFYGGMPRAQAEKSLRLFADKVLPAVQGMPTPINPASLG